MRPIRLYFLPEPGFSSSQGCSRRGFPLDALQRSIQWRRCVMNEHMTQSVPDKVNLAAKFATFDEHWKPKIAAELNGQQVKLVKFLGAFVWHHHEAEDELFLTENRN